VAPTLEQAVARALACLPAERFQKAEDFADVLALASG
jgi:hypothetical protein